MQLCVSEDLLECNGALQVFKELTWQQIYEIIRQTSKEKSKKYRQERNILRRSMRMSLGNSDQDTIPIEESESSIRRNTF